MIEIYLRLVDYILTPVLVMLAIMLFSTRTRLSRRRLHRRSNSGGCH